MNSAEKIDFDRLNAAACARMPGILEQWLPGGQAHGREYACAGLNGGKGRSLSVNTETGVWKDFASDEGGGDAVSLFAAIHGLKQGEAAHRLADELGVQAGEAVRTAPRLVRPTWTPILPVPANAPAASFQHPGMGRPSATWTYRNAEGALLGHVCRFDPKDERKQIVPLTFCGDGKGNTRWQWKQFADPRPLYGLELLANNQDAPVLVVEGEKACDAARAISGSMLVVTWPAGSNAVGKADWSPLKGRRVAIWPDADEPGRKAALALAALAEKVGFTLVGIIKPDASWPEGADIADFPAWTKEDLAREIKARMVDMTTFKDGVPASASEGGRPVIRVREGALSELADACEDLLMQPTLPANMRVLQRGGVLVRVATLPASTVAKGVKRSTGAAMIVQIDSVFLQDLLGRLAQFMKVRHNKVVPVDVPRAVAEMILARRGLWKLPFLRGVVSCPTLRAGGSFLGTAGYDPDSGYFLTDALEVAIPEKPTKDDAKKALASLLELLAGFSFVEETDRAVALALVLTAIVRPALDAAPIFGITAPVRGSGKSTVGDIAAVLSTGRRAAVLSATTDAMELEKRLVGCLLSGDALVSLDNVNGVLHSDLLCQACTAEAVKVRPLGASSQVEIPNAALFTVNGNNLSISGDLSRRALLCRLDPGVERPEERRFDFDPVERAARQRKHYVSAALTLLRAYVAAGSPDMGMSPFGSFEAWSGMVRAAMVWAGTADPCASRALVMEEDPELVRLKAVLAAWFKRFQRTPRSVRELIKASQEDDSELVDPLEDVAGDGRGNINSQRLGFWLRRNVGRIVGSHKLQRFGEKKDSALWQVVEV